MEKKYGDDLAIFFVHQPLPFHKNAKPAAIAMQAAAKQGKGWEMHDKMFANQQGLTRDGLLNMAKAIGLDLDEFEADLDSDELKAQVESDQKLARKVGATGTPMFFINGVPLSGAQPFKKFVTVIDAELKEANKLLESGTPIADIYEKRSKANVAAGS